MTMNTVKRSKDCACTHLLNGSQGDVILISAGGPRRNGGCPAAALCDALPARVLSGVCRYDNGHSHKIMAAALAAHRAAIIVDTTCHGTTANTVTISNMGTAFDRHSVSDLRARRGAPAAYGFRKDRGPGHLPRRVIFFEVEIDEGVWSWRPNAGFREQMPALVASLSLLIARMVETVKRDAKKKS